MMKDVIVVVFFLLLCVILGFLPNKQKSTYYQHSIHAKAEVLAVDNEDIQNLAVIRIGTQKLDARLLNGPHEGSEIPVINQLQGKMEFDEIYRLGDNILVEYRYKDDKTVGYSRGYYRLEIELFLAVLFALFLIAVAGVTGFKALISFVFAGLLVWKVMIPLFLRDIDPFPVAILVVGGLTASVSLLIGGISRKGLVTFIGSFSGLFFASVLSLVFASGFRIHGAVRPFAEALLYSGYAHLDLSRIFISGIIIACSGAVMDLAMDISAAMHEIIEKKPDIKFTDHVLSGLRVGRSVIGTMTTTLLLAYSGGYTTMLMFHMGEGTPMVQFLNINYIAAEILNVFVGSFGLVAVAPFTALTGGLIYRTTRSSAILLNPVSNSGDQLNSSRTFSS